MRRTLRILSSFFVGMVLTMSPLANASPETALDWLQTQQTEDGGIYTDNDVAASFQSTYQARAVLEFAQRDGALDQAALDNFLFQTGYDSVEYLAGKLLSGINATGDGQSIKNLLLNRRNSNGGFGDKPGYQSTPYDTYWALLALEVTGNLTGEIRNGAVSYLLGAQKQSGAWQYATKESSYLTSRVSQLLSLYRTQYLEVPTALADANNFLITASSSQPLTQFFAQCAALSALSTSSTTADLDPLSAIISTAQSNEGHWQGDIFTTALCLHAQLQFEAWKNGQPQGLNSISGRVVQSGSSEPLANVQISASGGSVELTSTSNDSGLFSISGLPSGAADLVFSKPGYAAVVKYANLSGNGATLGDIPMALDAGSTSVLGQVVNAQTGQPLSGVNVQVGGFVTLSDQSGNYFLSGLAAGETSYSASLSGYYNLGGQIALPQGSVARQQLSMIPLGVVLDDSPADLTGTVIDGESDAPVGAEVVVEGVGTFSADSTGRFTIPNVPRGDYAITLSATDYATANYQLSFPAGASGELGQLPIYPASGQQAAESIFLHVTVLDAVTRQPVDGASVTLDTGLAGTTNTQGTVDFADISALSFNLSVSAAAYLPAQLQATASGYGETSVEVLLTPDSGELSETSTLSGRITDTENNAIAGAMVSIVGGPGGLTDDQGYYQVVGIDQLAFEVRVTKTGYQVETVPIAVSRFGNYQLDLSLEEIGIMNWYVAYIDTPSQFLGANEDAVVLATIQNLTGVTEDVIVRGELINGSGEWVAGLVTWLPDSTEPAGAIPFAESESKTLELALDTAQYPPGDYQVLVRVIQNGSISSDLPGGVVYASGAESLTIAGTFDIAGDIDFTPPLVQAGGQTPVTLQALLRNAGNVPLAAGSYALILANESGEEILSRTVEHDEIPVGNLATLDFGEWVPSVAGHLSVIIRRDDLPQVGEINALYYVGDLASATFSLDRNVLPEGDNLVRATLDVRGVDTTQQSSTDPLYEQALEAVSRGGEFVGNAAINWHKSNRCLGCHIQTQSLVGLASALGQTEIDKEQTKFLYNVIAGSQRNSGSLNISHNNYVKTQTEFGIWALSEWPDKQASHRAKLNAMEYLWGRRSTSGGTVYWTDEHNSGWFRVNHESTTAVVAKAIADLIRSDGEIGTDVVPDMERTAQINLDSQSSRPLGTAVFNDTVFIAKRGAVEVFYPDTGETEPYFIDAANRQFYDVALDESGVLYATADDRIVRINSDHSIDELVISSGLRDIVLWNGDFYVAEWDSHRIWRVSLDLQAEVFAAGGLLNNPQGLSISRENNLLVANRAGFNVLQIDDSGVLSIFVDGFAYPPKQISRPDSSGQYYVTTERYTKSGSTKPPAVQRIRQDGTLENLFDNSNASDTVYGLAVVGSKLYYTDNPGNQIEILEATDLDRSLVATLKNNLPNIANYFLGQYNSNDNEILNIAFRLVGLGEIGSVTQDAALQASINQAIPVIEQLLRNRQRGDGGWGRYSSYGSDPLTTAWVGYALDYTNPSAEDPMVRNAITYLLNTQRTNGSWGGQYFSTALGSTSMVMAYMPRALERLGGLDVQLNLEMPLDIGLQNPSTAPTEILTLPDSRQNYRWDLLGVTGSGRTINMDLAVEDLLLNEIRPAADLAQLHFANSFTGETITRDIDIPSVMAISDLMLTTATDKLEYIANEPVDILSSLVNGGEDFSGGRLVLSIRNSAGETLEVLADQPEVNLTEGQQASYPHTWNTGTYPSGPYQVHASVQDEAGEVQVEAVAHFSILPSDGQQPLDVSYGAGIYTDKETYLPYEPVSVFSRVQNLSINSQQAPVLAKIRVQSPAGEILLSRNIVIPQLTANGLRDYQDLLQLADALPGIYSAGIEIWNADVSELLASDKAYFAVIDQPLAHLLGEVSVNAASVYRGQSVSCQFQAENRSGSTSLSLDLHYQLVNADTQSVAQIETESTQLAPGQQHVVNRQYDTSPLEPGGYACLLTAALNGETLTLGFAGFTVLPPPVTVDTGIGEKGRLLVLLDDPASSGPGEISSLQQQYDYLRALLDEEGYSYTIVFNAEDFVLEFHSGLYQAYALMSEQVTLSVNVEQELGEAVNRGDGLLISGAFNRRNNHLERALGILVTGRETQADGVLILDGALGENWMATVINPAIKLDFERCGARLLGVYINPVKGTQTDDPTCYDNSGMDAAAAGHDYGLGYSVFIGFDTLDEATALGGHNTYTEILRHSLAAIQPDEFDKTVGHVVPVAFVVQADDAELDARVTLTLPDNVQLIDQVPQLQMLDADGRQWLWQDHLQPGETQTLSLYLKLLDEAPVSIDVLVEAAVDGGWFEVNQFTHSLAPNPLGDPLAGAIALLSANGGYTQALSDAQAAQSHWLSGNSSQAIDSLLAATAALMDATEQDAIDARLLLDQTLFYLLAL